MARQGAKALITGFVQQRPDGRLTVGCYVYDLDKGRELGRKGFVAAPSDWRRAAHKCSGLAYKAITGSPGMFDTRMAYVAETGRRRPVQAHRRHGQRRLQPQLCDSGRHDRADAAPVAEGRRALPTSVSKEAARRSASSILISGHERPLLPGDAMTFAPRYSPDGSQIVFSMMLGANSDIYVVNANGGIPRRLTTSPGIDTDPSFSPDGSKIVFESDRAGSQQLYVMNADGSSEQRITFSTSAYSSPEWSPDGTRIAFTWRFGDTRRIGTIKPDGTGEKVLTAGPADEGPSWAASSREILFQRTEADGRPASSASASTAARRGR